MGDRPTPRELLLANLDVIHQLVEYLARRYRLAAQESEDLEAYVRLRLVENDFQILRSFQGRSGVQTYLVVVVQRLFLDYRNQTWGKWRTSAAARREGGLAEALEALVYRDGYTFAEACQVLLVSRKVATSEEALRALWESMPLRWARPPLSRGADVPEDEPDPAPTPERLAVNRRAAEHLRGVLAEALRRLPARDRLLLRLRFTEGLTVAAIADLLKVPPKTLYDRSQELAKRLRRELKRAGVAPHDVAELLADRVHGAVWDGLIAESTASRPSNPEDAGVDERES
jgi:RNA polymerase sigma factor for flagellar operon FliA